VSDLFRREAVQHATRRLAGEVVLASPLPFWLLGGLLIAVVVGALAFACFATYARRETVTGWIVPTGGLIRVTARQAGVVEEVSAHEGDIVPAGASMANVRLSMDVSGGDTGRAMASSIAAEGEANEAQSRTAAQKLLTQRAEMSARVDILGRQLGETKTRASILEKRQSLSEAEVTRGEALLTKGFLSQSSMDELRATALSTAQDASAARAAVMDLDRQVSDLTHEIAAVPADIEALKAQSAQTRAALAEKRISTEAQATFIATAPVAGRVVAIPVERGQTVAPGAAVAVLTPLGSNLLAELYVPSRASGFIKPGQDVRLQYQAFPYQTFGSGHGRVLSVSRTVLAPTEVAIPGLQVSEPVFRIRAVLERQSVFAYGHDVALQPGMLLTADIITDRRNLIHWLLDPLYAVGRRS